MGHPIDQFVGAKVRLYRVHRGLSQGQLAGHLGVSFQQIQKYENSSNRISASTLMRVAQYLNVPVENFFPGSESGEAATTQVEAPASPMHSQAREILEKFMAIDDAGQRRGIVQLIQTIVRE